MIRFIRFKRSFETVAFEEPELTFAGNAFLPSIALVPLQQHTGKPSDPVLSPGEHVREGQLIARGTSPFSVHVHAPVPGIIQEYKMIPLPDGTVGKAAVIKLSGSFDILGRKVEKFPWKSVPESEILRVLEDKGVINTFENPLPLVPVLRKAKSSGSAVLAIRLFDADPTCQLDDYLVRSALAIVLEGTAVLAKGMDASTVYLVYAGKKWTGPTEKELAELFQNRKVFMIKSNRRYPSGNTSQFNALVSSVCPSKNVPVLIDPVTAISSYEAVVNNQPVLYRTVIVTGPALGSPAILKVRIGTPIGDVIEECGGFKTSPGRIIVNGLLSGTAVYDLDTPITKNTKSIHIMDIDTCPSYTVRNCIHCGRCLHVCPVGIDPMRVTTGIEKGKFTERLLTSVKSCQFCGCCAIVCPSRIPLHHIIREASSRVQKGEKV